MWVFRKDRKIPFGAYWPQSTGRKEIIQNRKRNRKEKSEVRVERKGQGFRRKDTGEIRCNSLFKSVLRRDLCQHNLIKWEESKTMQRKTVTGGKINTEENQRKNFIQFAARARHVRASQMLGNFHYYLSETITHLILL